MNITPIYNLPKYRNLIKNNRRVSDAMFQIIPAVDLKEGRAVQLIQGDMSRERLSVDDPILTAESWIELGARLLHIIDLDRGHQRGDNLSVIEKLVKLGTPIQVGGGIREENDARELLEMGVDRVILGTIALEQPEVVKVLSNEYGPERIMVALDAKGTTVVFDGWRKTSEKSFSNLIPELEKMGAGSFLYTNVEVEGLLEGIDLEVIRQFIRQTSRPVVIAGGISSIDDVLKVKEAGAWGAVLGSAIYTGEVDLKNAMEAVKMNIRGSSFKRKTSETEVEAHIDIDSKKDYKIETGIPFFDHMLSQMAKHGSIELNVKVKGDLEVDDHHTVEDTAIVLGNILNSLSREGIKRFAHAIVPMDEAVATLALDVSGRGGLNFQCDFSSTKVGGLSTQNIEHFLTSLAQNAGITLYVKIEGENDHHKVEACFKALGLSLKEAFRIVGKGVPSTKGAVG